MPEPPFHVRRQPSPFRGGLFEAAGDRDAEPPPLTVTQACDRAKGALEGVGRLRIVGEVSNFTARNHWYFSVKDEGAVLNCVAWASTASRATFQPGNGMEVVVTGRLTYYGPSGRAQLVVDKLERRGQGTLQQRFEELCRVLRAEGYFDEARKRPLPAYPRRVAVITARHGAALQDVLRTARLRAPFVELLVVEVPVQGEGAAAEVACAIRAVDRRADELGIDAMIVTRGGGSLEDLWAFNERVVADAVFSAVTPVVAAIGHETDTTVIELVADRRASTPTQAAMLLLPDRAQMAEQANYLTDRLGLLVRKRLRDAAREVEVLARHPFFRTPQGMLEPHQRRVEGLARRLALAPTARLHRAARRLAEARTAWEALRPAARHALAVQRVEELRGRLNRAMEVRAAGQAERVQQLARHLQALGPQQVLARGYSITFGADGSVVRRASDAPTGAQLLTRLAEGSVRSVVCGHDEAVTEDSPSAS